MVAELEKYLMILLVGNTEATIMKSEDVKALLASGDGTCTFYDSITTIRNLV